jgi:hypothetical protein
LEAGASVQFEFRKKNNNRLYFIDAYILLKQIKKIKLQIYNRSRFPINDDLLSKFHSSNNDLIKQEELEIMNIFDGQCEDENLMNSSSISTFTRNSTSKFHKLI